MTSLTFTKTEPLLLKNHPEFTEQWLQKLIADDPSVLGFGEVVLIERERRQPKAGRLDLLLAEPDENRRYEVELQLGQTDEAHIIRCIEYWDIERRRYPGYEHVAVIVAEDITSRFLNVLSLFSGSIPLMGLQLNAIKIGDKIALHFVRVLDSTELRREDEAELTETDRSYWNNRASPQTVGMADTFLEIINEKAVPKQQLNYNKYYVGLHDGSRSRNFVHFRPKKRFIHLLAAVSERDAWAERFEEAGLATTVRRDRYVQVTVTPKELPKNRELLTELLHKAVEEFRGE